MSLITAQSEPEMGLKGPSQGQFSSAYSIHVKMKYCMQSLEEYGHRFDYNFYQISDWVEETVELPMFIKEKKKP